MTKVTVNIMGIKVNEYETEKEITIESILKGVASFKKEMDKLGVTTKVSSRSNETGVGGVNYG